MVVQNKNFTYLSDSYLFVHISKRINAYINSISGSNGPARKIIRLGVGDTTQPLVPTVRDAMAQKVHALGTQEGYTGYPDYNGTLELRELICERYYAHLNISPDEVFISDGAKPDLARLQFILPSDAVIAVQDPAYPAYVDQSVISGKSTGRDETTGKYKNLVYMPCTAENDYFPTFDDLPERVDLIIICSPNNPTGAVATRPQLERAVAVAKAKKAILLFDSAYVEYIKDPRLPRSIFEIEGAHEVSMEICSFSKSLGFTGVRCGFVAIPRACKFEDGATVHGDWKRVAATCFNGPCNISESGAIAALKTPQGRLEMRGYVDYYMENAKLLRQAFEAAGFVCIGGDNSPYLWCRLPWAEDSWQIFDDLLRLCQIVITPGGGFGELGQKDCIRVSAFAPREDVLEACSRLSNILEVSPTWRQKGVSTTNSSADISRIPV